MKKRILYILLIIFQLAQLSAQEKGTISGTVFEKKTGETIIGATVVVVGTSKGTVTDFDGKYILKLAPGKYNLQFSFVSYQTQIISEIEVVAAKVNNIDVSLGEVDLQLDEIVITAKESKRSENSIMLMQSKSAKIVDGISSQQMSKLGDDNAADALKRVTGVTVQNGKYVFVRGLGDRYTKTTLNNAEIPSLDPQRNSVQMDLFPNNIIDNIIVSKTFTPDMPGESTGGQVDIRTRDFQDQFNLQFSTSFAYNTLSSFRSDYVTKINKKWDWLGIDGAERKINPVTQSYINMMHERGVSQIAFPYFTFNEIGNFTKSFNLEVVPVTKKSFMNQSHKLSFGDRIDLSEKKALAYNFSLSYDNNYSYYDDGKVGLYYGEIPSSNKVVTDRQGTQNVIVSGYFNINYKFNNKHEIGLRIMRNQAGTKTGRYRDGTFNYESAETYIQERITGFMERNISLMQLHGKHILPNFKNASIYWQSSYTKMNQLEPDATFFTNLYVYDNAGIPQFRFKTNTLPSRIYRDLAEINFDNKLDVELPLAETSRKSKLKFGASYVYKDRNMYQQKFELRLDNVPYEGNFKLDGNIPQLIRDNVISSSNQLGLSYVMDEENNKINSYTATASYISLYAMADIMLTDKFRFVGGLRYEASSMITANKSTVNYKEGSIIRNDFLPSLNLIYSLKEKMNVKFAFSQTIARPQFKEFAPQSFYDYKLGMRLNGNPNLKRSFINNLDLRWENYLRPGEMLAVSGFYKKFKDAIEQRLDPGTPNFESSFFNSKHAYLYGIELEIREKLDFWELSKYFNFGGNITLVKSNVALTQTEQLFRKVKTRPMSGQAPYVANLYLGYDNSEKKWSANLGFNISGKKIVQITQQATPYVYELPKPALNFNINKGFGEHIGIELSADNLLNSEYRAVYQYPAEYGGNITNISYKTGINFGIKFRYTIK